MASSPVSQQVEHISTCLSKKKQYDSRQEAEQFEVRNREKYDQSRQYAYACEDCNKWHLSCMSPDAVTMARVNYSRLGVGNTRGNHGETEAKVNELHAKGLDCKQIAIELNVTKAAVSYHLNKLSTSKDGRSHKSARIKLPDIPGDLSEIEREKQQLQARLANLIAAQEKIIEAKRLKLNFCWDRKGVLIEKEGQRLALSLEDCGQLTSRLEDMLTAPGSSIPAQQG